MKDINLILAVSHTDELIKEARQEAIARAAQREHVSLFAHLLESLGLKRDQDHFKRA